MGLITTPREYAGRAEMYHRLAQLLSAGFTIIRATHELVRTPPLRSFREPLNRIRLALENGMTFAEAAQNTGGWIPQLDLALLRVGEETGKLDLIFQVLARYYQERAMLSRTVIAEMIYPALLLHVAVLLLGFVQFVKSWNTAAYFAWMLTILIPLYLLTFFTVLVVQGKFGDKWRALVERFCKVIPGLGPVQQHLALARLALALEALVAGGYPILRAWTIAAEASGSFSIKRTVSSWQHKLESGETPAALVQQSPEFPELFANLYATGEMSGKLDEALQKLSEIYQEEGSRALRTFAKLAPRIIYILVVIWVAYHIVRFWVEYYGGVLKEF